MKKNKLKKTLFRFLKERGIFGLYKANFKENRQTEIRKLWCDIHPDVCSFKPDNGIDSFCECIKQEKSIIVYSFSWTDTRQGYAFWKKISNEWLKNCDNICIT